MLKSAPLIAFVATTDAARATRFYAEVLGLTFMADEPHAAVFDAAGTMLRIQKAQAVTPRPYTALGWRVDDITGTVARLLSLTEWRTQKSDSRSA